MANSVPIDLSGGLGPDVLACTIIHCVFAIVAVALRAWVRIKSGAIGKDDYLMFIALIVYIACCIFTFGGCFSGLGSTDQIVTAFDPTGKTYNNGLKWFFLFLATYMVCHPFIKLSICVALLRISRAKRFVIPLWIIIFLSIFTSLLGLGAVLDQCHPIAANWEPSVGECTKGVQSSKIVVAVSAISIIIDWSCAILPALLLWNLNMRLKTKVSLAFILALGALASISTCIRFPYIRNFSSPYDHGDNLRRAANITIWSIVECGIGIIAGSLPPLQPLFRRFGFGIGATRVKLTDGNMPRDHVMSSFHRRNFTPTTPEATAQRTRHSSVDRGNWLVTTKCEGGRPREEWWDQYTMVDDDATSQKLIILKNTQIDIEYGAADPAPAIGSER
ncbi:uncharacterized protein F4822DRAFT_115348 [Hypoxylon trugodes]|uniref:uncharacterized protein n=1 Tax=Hypoxylon trugodes TaxID=326681 RepID=UPI00219708C3|nr:uncharacterized protein F4822DRAFT_115348 [Hypoxylon trugodes]KAI1392093.1 hypothetical protein F4822DRAFT_115348 [Hypoxylon trugodes]